LRNIPNFIAITLTLDGTIGVLFIDAGVARRAGEPSCAGNRSAPDRPQLLLTHNCVAATSPCLVDCQGTKQVAHSISSEGFERASGTQNPLDLIPGPCMSSSDDPRWFRSTPAVRWLVPQSRHFLRSLADAHQHTNGA